MPMSRKAVYVLIDKERQYQNSTFNPDATVAGGHLFRSQRDLDVTPHLVLLHEYIEKAMRKWTDTKTDETYNDNGGHYSRSLPALREIAKVAAIAVRALEVAGASEQLLEAGLR